MWKSITIQKISEYQIKAEYLAPPVINQKSWKGLPLLQGMGYFKDRGVSSVATGAWGKIVLLKSKAEHLATISKDYGILQSPFLHLVLFSLKWFTGTA